MKIFGKLTATALATGFLIFSFNVYVLDMANNQITGTLPNRIDDDVITNEVRVGRINAFRSNPCVFVPWISSFASGFVVPMPTLPFVWSITSLVVKVACTSTSSGGFAVL